MKRLLSKSRVLLIIIFITGLFLRFSYPTMIEFSYDPALFSEATIKILENNDYLNARDYYPIDHHATGAYTIGPLYYFMRFPSIAITKNPVALAMVMAFLNNLMVLFCYFIGKRFFNERIGWISSSLYAVSPWAIIFSRNVIPYAFIPIFIAIFIFCLLDVIHKNRSKKIALCLISMVVLIQLVQWGLLVPIILILALIFLRPKINWKFFSVGLLGSLILLYPHIYWDIKNDFHDSKNLMNAVSMLSFGQGDFFSKFTFSNIGFYFDYYLKVGSAQKFEYHLGYALNDFNNSLHSVVGLGIRIEYFLILFGFLFVAYKFVHEKIHSYSQKNKNVPLTNSYVVLLIWVLVTLLVFIVFQPEGWPSLPRYYLFFFPSQFIFASIFLEKIANLPILENVHPKLLWKKSVMIILLLVLASNSIFIIHYFQFLNNYSYGNWLSSNSDIPYKFSYDALYYIQNDSESQGYKFVTVSDDIRKRNINNPNPGINYLMHYTFNNWYDLSEIDKNKTIH